MSTAGYNKDYENRKHAISTKKRNECKRKLRRDTDLKTTEAKKKHIRNLSDYQMTRNQTGILSRGLKFIPTPVTNESHIRKELLRDFSAFARRIRSQYIFHGQAETPHPFHVRSNWEPPVQPSVALETYLEEVKIQLAEIPIAKPKNNLPKGERQAIKELKSNSEINVKRADKGSSIVIFNKQDKLHEGQMQLDEKDNYKTLETPMVVETSQRVDRLINKLYQGNYIDKVTNKWLSLMPNPPRVSDFYTLTKIHKPKPVGSLIVSGYEGPKERISSFFDTLLQPIAKAQTSYLRDTKDFIDFIEKTKVGENVTLVSMDVTSLSTNIPREEGIDTVCKAYVTFYGSKPPIPTQYLREMLRLILKENSFQFNGKNSRHTEPQWE